jgi:indolepyruvate decarboxylase
VTFIGQPLWGSIGYTLPAALGAAVAHPDRRTVLIIGDGAAQLTVQELGAFSREALSPVIVVVNNDGYTIERAIHGQTAPYNDIVSWQWTDVPRALGVTDHLSFRVQTYGELDDALTAAAQHQDRMVFVEVILPRLEIPNLLVELVRPTSPDGSPRR